MCIALLSTAHPNYKLILLDNRDEFISRPTARATWWSSPHTHVLGGRDLLRSIQGTWLGVTRTGRIAVLTNFREDVTPPPKAVSRGEIIKKFLTEDTSTEDFVRDVVGQGVARDAGGFSLVCGRLGTGEQLAVLSNRARSGEEVPWICGDVVQTVGLSNTHFGDGSWPKVVKGEREMLRVLRENIEARKGHGEDKMVKTFLGVLSDDELTNRGLNREEGLERHVFELRNTIFVPPLGRRDTEVDGNGIGLDLKADEIAAAKKGEVAKVLGKGSKTKLVDEAKSPGTSGIYATQKQTVVLVDKNDRVRFVERTLFDENSEPISEEDGTLDITFQIEEA